MTQSNHPVRVNTEKALAAVVGLIGAGGSVVLPGAAIVLGELCKHMDKKSASKTMSYLKYNKLIAVRAINDEQVEYRLTGKGIKRWQKIVVKNLAIEMPYRWDKKWRLVMYDIPSHKGLDSARWAFTEALHNIDFYMLQKSSWIHPFDCREEVGVLAEYYGINKYVSYLVVEDGNFIAHATAHFKKRGLLK